MPDGEVGPRKHWISRVHYQVLAGHAELETVRHPAAGERRRAAQSAQRRRLLAVQGQGRRRARTLRRSRLAARLYARRGQFIFRVQDAARERRAGQAPALPGVAAVGQQRAAAADFSEPCGRRQDQARLYRCARRRNRHDRAKDPERGSGDPVGLLHRGAGRLWRGAGSSGRRRDRTQCRAVSPAVAARSRDRDARVSLLLRHARRLAALCAGRSFGDGRACQCRDRKFRPPRRLDSPSGARRMSAKRSSLR